MVDLGQNNASDQPNQDEAQSTYLRLRNLFGEAGSRSNDARKRGVKKEGSSVPFGAGRDPHGLSDVIDGLTKRMGWTSPLAQSELLASWPEIAGIELAEHSTPT